MPALHTYYRYDCTMFYFKSRGLLITNKNWPSREKKNIYMHLKISKFHNKYLLILLYYHLLKERISYKKIFLSTLFIIPFKFTY